MSNTLSGAAEHNARLMRNATYASVAVASLLILIKLAAYMMTDSVALLATLIDSMLDVVASVINLLAVRHALTPADREHRFGHGKAEPLAGLGQSAFISGSALFLFAEAAGRIVNPRPVEKGFIGIAVMIVSIVLTIALVQYQRFVVKRTGSMAIGADSLHYVSDILVNLSVIVALILSAYLGWTLADPLFGLGVGGYVLYSAWKIVRQALDHLMDREFPDEDRARIQQIVRAHPEVRNLHDLRTRYSGHTSFVQLHLEMDGNMSLYRAHRISDEVAIDIRKAFPNADVIIHEDPAGLEEEPPVVSS